MTPPTTTLADVEATTDRAAQLFLEQVGAYLEAVGWRAIVAGPIGIEPRDELRNQYRLLVDFMGGQRVVTIAAADDVTFGDLAIGDTFAWRDTADIQHGPPGPEAMRKATATRYEWSRGYGHAESHYPVRRLWPGAAKS